MILIAVSRNHILDTESFFCGQKIVQHKH